MKIKSDSIYFVYILCYLEISYNYDMLIESIWIKFYCIFNKY